MSSLPLSIQSQEARSAAEGKQRCGVPAGEGLLGPCHQGGNMDTRGRACSAGAAPTEGTQTSSRGSFPRWDAQVPSTGSGVLRVLTTPCRCRLSQAETGPQRLPPAGACSVQEPLLREGSTCRPLMTGNRSPTPGKTNQQGFIPRKGVWGVEQRPG